MSARGEVAKLEEWLQVPVWMAVQSFSRVFGRPVTGGMVRRFAGVFREVCELGVVSVSGESRGLLAALSESEFEAVLRQREYIRGYFARRDSRGRWLDDVERDEWVLAEAERIRARRAGKP